MSVDVEKLKAEHGEVWSIEVGGEHICFRCPESKEADYYIGKLSDSRKDIGPLSRKLASEVVVHPSKEAFGALVKKRGGIALSVANEAIAVYMGKGEEDAKKL